MSIGRHSYVAFYTSDWLAGTARMPRLVKSVYHDICLYNWDKNRAAPSGEIMLMVSDLENGSRIIDALVENGTLVRNDDGSVYSPRALLEAEKAFDLWQKKSRGGKSLAKTVSGEIEESSKSAPAEPSPEPEPFKEGEANASPKKAAGPIPAPIVQMIVDKWNAVAKPAKLSLMLKLTEERSKRLRSRVGEHGAQAIIEAIDTIPTSPFLMGGGKQGWKMNFDSLLQPEMCAKLIEGFYHNEGDGEQSAWLTN